MATTITPPTASPAPTGGDSAMDSIMDSAFAGNETSAASSEPTESAPPPEQTTQDAPETPATEPAVEEVEQPEETPVAQEVAPQIDPEDEMQADRISEDPKRGKTLHFREAKAQKLFAARDFQKQLQDLDPTVTVESIREMYDRTIGLDTLLADYGSADPQRAGKVAQEFFGKGQNPEAVEAFTHQSLATVAREHPALFKKVSDNIMLGWAQQRYQAAMQRTGGDQAKLETDPDYILAANLDFAVRQSYRAPTEFSQRDPLQAQREQFNRERSEFYGAKQREHQAWVNQQVQAVENEKNSAVTEEIANALKPVEEAYKATPHWKHMQRDLQEKVDEALKANPVVQRRYDVALEGFKANPTDESRTALVTMMRQFASAVIAKNKKAVIEAQTGKVLSASQAAHQKQQQIAQRVEPAGNNTAVRRATLKQQVQGAKGYDEAWKIVDQMFS